MDRDEQLAAARAARENGRYRDAYEAFRSVTADGRGLAADDLNAWSDAAWWLGNADEAFDLGERGYQAAVAAGADLDAAIQALDLGFLRMLRGEFALGSGWLERSRSLLADGRGDVERGLLTQFDAEMALQSGDHRRALELAEQAGRLGRAANHADVTAMARMTEGVARVRLGDVARGMAALDDAMLAAGSGELSPGLVGNLYCQMIALCWALSDLRRAREWTATTQAWLDGMDSAVMFAGICRMHRVQLAHVGGAWDEAAHEARTVTAELAHMNRSVVAEGHYLLGDLLRLRGAGDDAEAAYRRAHEQGRDPQPGLALLRADRGRLDAAQASLRTALAAADGLSFERAPLLRAQADVAARAGDVALVATVAEELARLAETWDTDGLRAAASHAQGLAHLVAGRPEQAVPFLRAAARAWLELEAPYDCARARVDLADALTAVGDDDAAAMELDAAAACFRRLDAIVDLARLDLARAARARGSGEAPGGLTPREVDVLVAVAAGGTNRDVAGQLFISEKTVARHLANIHLKLGVQTRTAAAAWAHEHGLLHADTSPAQDGADAR